MVESNSICHICGKNYVKYKNRVIRCYTNDGDSLTMYINGVSIKTVPVVNSIATFTDGDFYGNNEIEIDGTMATDSFTLFEYVEIGGTKWATMNDGSSSVTDNGLNFLWGDTLGSRYTGNGYKYFGWEDYKFNGGGSNSHYASDMLKYNNTDNKTILENSDDAATVILGSGWRMPTSTEFLNLLNASDVVWTTSYQNSIIKGIICKDKEDSSKTLFFPAAGLFDNGSAKGVNHLGYYYIRELTKNDLLRGRYFGFSDSSSTSYGMTFRYYGFPFRGVYHK